MKKRTNLKLNFKKERITKLNNLHLIKGGDTGAGDDDNTVIKTFIKEECEPQSTGNGQ